MVFTNGYRNSIAILTKLPKLSLTIGAVTVAVIVCFVCAASALAIDPTALSNDLTAFENKYFAESFTSESPEQRLDRIERMVYGARKSGSIDARVTRLLLDVPDLKHSNTASELATNHNDSETPATSHSSNEPKFTPTNSSVYPGAADREAVTNSQSAVYPPVAANSQGAVYPPVVANPQGVVYPPVAANPQGAVYPPVAANSQGAVYPPVAANPQGAVYPLITANPPSAAYPPNSTYAPNSMYPTASADQQNLISPQMANARQGQIQENDANNSGYAVPDSDDYPTISSLENEILGKSHKNLPVKERLSNMERKAFGAPSTLHDLSKRVEILEQYVAEKNGKNEDYLTTSEPAVTWKSRQPSLISQVDGLEKKVFGKTYGRDGLVSRVSRLEKAVFPQEAQHTFNPTAERINRLQSAVQPLAFNNTRVQTPNQPPQHHFLHKLGKFLGGVGVVAGEALGSAVSAGSYMGGYGMGFPGFGYGGMGYGYPGYGMPGRFMGMY